MMASTRMTPISVTTDISGAVRLSDGSVDPTRWRVGSTRSPAPPLLGARGLHRNGVDCRFLHLFELVLGQRNQAALGQIAARAHGVVAHILLDEFLEVRHHAAMVVLDVDEQRAGHGILAALDGLLVRGDAIDLNRLQLVQILVEERVAEDTVSIRVGFDALDDQVVVLAGLDERAIGAHALADFLLAVLAQRLDRRTLAAAFYDDELDPGIAAARGRRRT